MKTLKESRIELANLILANPDLPIKAKVDGYVIFDDNYSWFLADVKNPRIETYWEYGEQYYDDEDRLYNDIECDLEKEDFANPDPTYEEVKAEIERRIKELPSHKAIFVTVEN